ncbi:MAG: thiaminase II [Alphaproteobacteria bacterium]
MTGLFDRLKEAAQDEWQAYTRHAFVAGLADGSLPQAAFRHYLTQDYLFLIHFIRAYGLAVFKADRLEDMRLAAGSLSAILDVEMNLHVKLCEGWGLSLADMEATPEAPATMAYTRFVLERGLAGDLLDLLVALSPCVVGYGEIGRRLAGDPSTKRDDNPYWVWIEEYSCSAYAEVSEKAQGQLDRLARERLTEARFPALARTFAQATRLEAGFWQMGLDQAR